MPEPANALESVILVVEDNELNQRFLEKILAARGYTRVHSVASGEEALAQLDEVRPDLVLLDIIMPGGMDGYACCSAIRNMPRYADLPILIQTAITEPELRAKAFAAGASDFVNKPIYAEELCARMAVHLQTRHSLIALREYQTRTALELESARLLQQSILPSADELSSLHKKCGLDIAAHYQPSSEIGGDFWGLKQLYPHQAAVWIVDFSGHGVASALNAFRLQAYLKEVSALAARPGDYMGHLNEKLLPLLLRGQFATMFYGVADVSANQLIYACAAAPNPILLRQSGAVEVIEGRGHPLGVGIFPFTTQTLVFNPGDTLLLYSDALIETPNADGNSLTEAMLGDIMRTHATATAEGIRQAVLHAFYNHAAATPIDDLTLVVVRRAT